MSDYVPYNWDSPNWAAAHWLDWEHHIPDAVRHAWHALTPAVRKALAAQADNRANDFAED